MELLYSMSLSSDGISRSVGFAQKRCGQVTNNKIIPAKTPQFRHLLFLAIFVAMHRLRKCQY